MKFRSLLPMLLCIATSALVAQAQVFSTPKNISNNAGNSLFPRIAVEPSGSIDVVWEDDSPGHFDVFFSRSADGGATFSTPKNLSNDSAGASVPVIAVDSNGNINVVWNGNGNSGIFFSRSSDGGVTFSTPKNLSSNSLGLGKPQIALDSSGNINLVWVGEAPGSNLDIFFSRSTDGGVTFSTPKNLTNNSGFCGSSCVGNPLVAIDSSGNINVVWRGAGPGISDTFFSRSADGGVTFSTPKRISNSTNLGGLGNPQMAVDSSGNINVVWEEEQVIPVINIFFSRSGDGGATFSAPKNLSNNLAQSSLEQIAVDSGGNINVVWQELIPGQGQSDIFLTRSNDGGATFSTKNLSNDARSFQPQIAVDSSGNINVVWGDSSPGNSDIFLSRSTDGGATFSTPTNVSNNAGASSQPQIALDSGGNINLVWADTTPNPSFSPNDIFFASGRFILVWPVQFLQSEQITNNFAEYVTLPSGELKYHTGTDISADPFSAIAGKDVFAAADGRIVKIQGNDVDPQTPGCDPDLGRGCEDHTMGNTVIIEHQRSDGSLFYTQYSHLATIDVASDLDVACGPIDTGKLHRRTCSVNFPVSARFKIGTVGGSGAGKPDFWHSHLHFEVKDTATLGSRCDDGETCEWGYTFGLPGDSGYRDSILSLHGTTDVDPPLRVRLNTSGVVLRVGPGQLAAGTNQIIYRPIKSLSDTTKEYEAVSLSGETTNPSCTSGWYQIQNLMVVDDRELFDDPGYGKVPRGWVCADFTSIVSSNLARPFASDEEL